MGVWGPGLEAAAPGLEEGYWAAQTAVWAERDGAPDGAWAEPGAEARCTPGLSGSRWVRA